ncbi:cobalt ECF transporter T component CbiQ [Roseiflexus castenholzii]|uniref:cobalt ECF transporter T component CbiQ n=1 Tax=Roseiflexus castenholzii TaxID=120962 RepID=UPI003C79EAD2
MRVIDRYAFGNALRDVDPAQKGTLALLAIILCLVLDRPAVGMLTLIWMLALTRWWAGVPLPASGSMLLTEGVFLSLSVVGVALNIGGSAPDAPLFAWRFGPIWVSATPESLMLAMRVLTRALGSASALNFLILTTPLIDLIELLRRTRLPEGVIDIMALTYRAIFVLLDSLERMATAQDARLGYSTARAALRSAALLGSRVFLDAYRRSQRMQVALESRGFDGMLRVLPLAYRRSPCVWLASVALTASLALASMIG